MFHEEKNMVNSIGIPTTFTEAAEMASAAKNAAYRAGSSAYSYAQKNPVTVTGGVASSVLFAGSLVGAIMKPPKNRRDVSILGIAQISSYVLGAAALVLIDQQSAKKKS